MSSAALPAAPRRPLGITGSVWVLPPLVVLGALFLYPLSLIAGEALNGAAGLSVANFVRVVNTGAFRSALFNTLEISLAASAGCIVLGFVIALILSFVPFPGSRIVARLIETYIAVPTFLVALAFTFLYGSAGVLNEVLMQGFGMPLPPVNFLYSPWGVILAEVTVYTPFAMRPLLAAFSTIDPAQIEVATSLGGRARRIVLSIILPAAIPALLAGGSLCLLLTLNEFGIVLFIGAKGVITLPLLIYDKAIQEFDYTTACVVAVVNVVLSLSLYSLYRVLLVRFSGAAVLVWSSSGRATIWAFGALLIGLVYGAPVLIIAAASIAGHWNGVWPSDFTLRHYGDAFQGASGRQLWASFVTGVIASALAMVSGTFAALGLRQVGGPSRRILDLAFFAPSAVPSVSVGLGLLVAFSKPPVLLNGTTAIVIVAHFILISAFTYGAVSAGLARLMPEYEQIAESLGARPAYRLRRVTLPLLAPYLVAAFSLSFALSMGELGATVMVYPPGWVTLPVGIFALTDRGAVFDGAALTMLLIATTLIVLAALSWVANRFAPRSA